MKYVKGFFAFWYDFIVGDAWEVAAGVVICLTVLFLLTHYAAADTSGFGAYLWIVLPVVVVALLGYSLWRVRRTG